MSEDQSYKSSFNIVAEQQAVTAVVTTVVKEKNKSKKATKVDEPPKDRHMVVYTDGGCKPSRGIGGWGVHGYIFYKELPKQGSGCDQTPTDRGYVENFEELKRITALDNVIPFTDVVSDGISLVTLVEYVDGWGSLIPESTNNEAEMTALFNALYAVREKGVVSVQILADSEYTIKGLTEWSPKWEANGWVKPDGTAVANAELWKKIVAIYSQLLASGVEVKVNWVRGHSGNFGNERVDQLASASIIAGKKGAVINNLRYTEAKGYWGSKSDYNRMFSLPFWYFNTHTGGAAKAPDGRFIYYMGDHGKEDDFLGKPISDASFSVLLTKKMEPVLESIRKYQDDLDKGEFSSIVIGRLSQIFAPKQYNDILENMSLFLQQINWGKMDIYTVAELMLTKELRPPRVAFRVTEAMAKLECVLIDYLTKQKDAELKPIVSVTDITDLLYEVSMVKSQPATKLLSTVSSATKKLVVEVGYNTGKNSGTFKLPIALGLDIANRNTLSAITVKNPKVKLITWRESDVSFRYATIIETDDDAGIWASIYSNICLITS